jgi:hypothetical protein
LESVFCPSVIPTYVESTPLGDDALEEEKSADRKNGMVEEFQAVNSIMLETTRMAEKLRQLMSDVDYIVQKVEVKI